MTLKEAAMKKLGLLIPLLALALAAAACNSSGGESGAAGETGGGGSVAAEVVGKRPAEPGGGGPRGTGTVAASAVPQVGPQIIQNASMRLSIPHGRFEDQTDEVRTIAASFGGFVVSSTASQGSEQRLVSGSLVLRIPAESYDEAVSRLRRLGRVESLEESGQDVSKEFVDLHARARQLEAVEAQLLELLQRAKDVPAALAVQSQLSQVQLDLEQARGRLQYLANQVSYATISVAMHESGAVAPKGGGFGIVKAWETAAAGFLTVIGWILIGIAVIAPVFVLIGLGLLVGRALRRRLAHA
jgi:hypothetical protein